jgi:hypothetical protein
MPFDAVEVARQIEESRPHAHARAGERLSAIHEAVRIYNHVDHAEWGQRVQSATMRRWVGVPVSPLRAHIQHLPSMPDYCVVATDSSFIPPDKHRGSFCHLINVGRVMIRYGNQPGAELDSTPRHCADPLADDEEAHAGRVLQAKCALQELQELYELASRYRADLALLDGSLMQLVLVLSKEPDVVELMSEYFRTLAAFQDIGVPVVGYISRPESEMVMRAMRMLACDRPTPCEKRPADPCGCRLLWGINDGHLFEELLSPGQTSPVFQPVFSYLVGANAEGFRQLVFAYLATRYEVARLEFPEWVWQEGLLERTVSIVLHQCELGNGYPHSLTRAHQFAVLHGTDRQHYYFMLERAGLMHPPTEKAHSKQATGQSI